jgi:hypothetical protein
LESTRCGRIHAGIVLNPTALQAFVIAAMPRCAAKSSMTGRSLHVNGTSPPNAFCMMVDLPQPDGPTIRPTFHGASSYGKSPFHDSVDTSAIGTSNMADSCDTRPLAGSATDFVMSICIS